MRLPTLLRRRPAAAPQPGNPARLADDLRDQIAHSADLAAQLVLAKKRADAAERRAEAAEGEHQRVAAELVTAHREALALRKDRGSVRSQLDHALGYGAADLQAIETGTGQPRTTVTTI